MKNFKGTLLLLLVAVGVGAFAYFDFKSKKSEEEVKSKEDLIFKSVNQEDVVGLRWLLGSDEIQLSKKEGNWRMLSPKPYDVDESLVASFLNEILEQKASAPEEQAKNVAWGDYGLEVPKGSLVVEFKDGKSQALFVSSKQAFDKSYFLRIEKNERLFVGSNQWGQWIGKKAADFRNKKIFSSLGDIASVEVKSSGESFLLKENSGQWMVPGREDIRMDLESVANWLADLKTFSVSEFVAESSSPSALKGFGLDSAATKIAIELKNEIQTELGEKTKKVQITVSLPKANDVYLSSNLYSSVFKSFKTQTELFRKSLGELRDKSFPFKVDISKVHSVELKGPKAQVVAEKADGQWKLKMPEKNKTLDAYKLEQLVSGVSNLQALDFMKSASASKKDSELIFKTQAGEKIFRMEWSSATAKGKDGKEVFIAKTQLANETLSIDKGQMESLIQGPFVVDATKKEDAVIPAPGAVTLPNSVSPNTEKK